VVYGLGRVDASGRVADRTVICALGWRGGDRLTLTASARVVTARRDPHGLAVLPPRSGAPGQAVVDAAMLVLERMGLTSADLLAAPAARLAAPTFAEYIPVVSALVSDGCRKAYGSYWNRVTEQWGSRGIDEPTPSEIR
jgi:hypothetical protein